jgi:hypothetical protein
MKKNNDDHSKGEESVQIILAMLLQIYFKKSPFFQIN